MAWEVIVGHIAALADEIQYQIANRSAGEWILFFFPVLILFEIPRYFLPIWVLVIARSLGFGRSHTRREEAFLRKAPLVSVIIAGRNEEAGIEGCIRSLLDQTYPNIELIVVDDNSEDLMYERARRFARRGLVRLIRNNAARGRSGKPSCVNLGIRIANGDFIVSVDADCTFDRNMIKHTIAAFSDERVGVVAGNVVVHNQDVNLLTRLQTLEYTVAIDIWKQWNNLLGINLQASGAACALRRSALQRVGGWDQELAEDTDISMRMIKEGWKVHFASRAVTLTQVPEKLEQLKQQRHRWDRGTLRTIYKKHSALLNPLKGGWLRAIDLWCEFCFFGVATFGYPFFLLWLISNGPAVLIMVLFVSYLTYGLLGLLMLAGFPFVVTRLDRAWKLAPAAMISPLYKEIFRWVRLKAIVMEVLRLKYKDSFLPDSAWNHAPRY